MTLQERAKAIAVAPWAFSSQEISEVLTALAGPPPAPALTSWETWIDELKATPLTD